MNSTIHISLKQLGFLCHVRRLARDYHERVLEKITQNMLTGIGGTVPDTLNKKETTVFYKKHFGKFRFSRKCYDERSSQSHVESDTSQPGQDDTNTEQCSYGRIIIHINNCDIRDNDLTQQDLDNLTEVLTQEIYSYVELVNQYLESCKSTGSNVSEKLIMTGNAILNEIKDDESETEIEACPNEVVANLDKLPGVHGFGFSKDGFCVLAVKQSRKADIELKKQIKRATGTWKFPKIILLKNEPFCHYIHAGCHLVSQSTREEYEKSSGMHGYGSIGVFGTTDGGQLVFTTAGHIFTNERENAYVVKNGIPATGCGVSQAGARVLPPESPGLKLIGKCLGHLGAGIGNDADFTLVQVDNATEGECKQWIHHPDSEIPLKQQLYTKPPGNLKNKFVQTLRTEILSDGSIKTDITDGIVILDPYHFTGPDLQIRRNYIGVTGTNSNTFAMPGHSGAPVIKPFKNGRAVAKVVSSILYGPDNTSREVGSGASDNEEQDTSDVDSVASNDEEQDTSEVLSGASYDGDQDTSEVYEDCVYTWRMDEALAEVKEERNIRVNLQ